VASRRLAVANQCVRRGGLARGRRLSRRGDRVDRAPLATFLTDYSLVDQEVFEEGSDAMFPSHVEREAFSRTTDLTVVARSEVVGAMGPELIPFSEEGDVDAFVEEYGGEPMPATDVERSTLEAL